jgi:hypothetical protein
MFQTAAVVLLSPLSLLSPLLMIQYHYQQTLLQLQLCSLPTRMVHAQQSRRSRMHKGSYSSGRDWQRSCCPRLLQTPSLKILAAVGADQGTASPSKGQAIGNRTSTIARPITLVVDQA